MASEIRIDRETRVLLANGVPLTREAFRELDDVEAEHVAPLARVEYSEIDPLDSFLFAVGIDTRTGELVTTSVEKPTLGTYVTVVDGDDWESPYVWASSDEFPDADPKDFVELGSNGIEPGASGAHAVWIKRTEWEAATEASRRALQQRVSHLLRSDRQELDEYQVWAQLPLIALAED